VGEGLHRVDSCGSRQAKADAGGRAAEAIGAHPKVQQRQMENVAKLISNAGTAKMGYLDPAAYERKVKVPLAGGSSPVIKKNPGKAAYTDAVFDAASK
jgi:NitT/TauT family transport system substrate-binding protein